MKYFMPSLKPPQKSLIRKYPSALSSGMPMLTLPGAARRFQNVWCCSVFGSVPHDGWLLARFAPRYFVVLGQRRFLLPIHPRHLRPCHRCRKRWIQVHCSQADITRSLVWLVYLTHHPWNEEQIESLISLRYCAPLTVSTITFAPSFSGPKHQILSASVLSQSKCLHSFSALILRSPLGSISLFSIISTRLLSRGAEVPNILFNLLAVLVSKGSVTEVVMVSL